MLWWFCSCYFSLDQITSFIGDIGFLCSTVVSSMALTGLFSVYSPLLDTGMWHVNSLMMLPLSPNEPQLPFEVKVNLLLMHYYHVGSCWIVSMSIWKYFNHPKIIRFKDYWSWRPLLEICYIRFFTQNSWMFALLGSCGSEFDIKLVQK